MFTKVVFTYEDGHEVVLTGDQLQVSELPASVNEGFKIVGTLYFPFVPDQSAETVSSQSNEGGAEVIAA